MLAFIIDGAGFGEWFVLLAVVLIVVGPKKLPGAARKLGQFYNRFRRAAEGFKRQIMDMDAEIDRIAAETVRAADDAFKVEGEETKAEPAPEAEPFPYPGYEPTPEAPASEAAAPDAAAPEASVPDAAATEAPAAEAPAEPAAKTTPPETKEPV